ncbi:MAG: response regulator [Parvibaculaceae bacterium]|nr:response regulator [Parvibaculaceae bacterium]
MSQIIFVVNQDPAERAYLKEIVTRAGFGSAAAMSPEIAESHLGTPRGQQASLIIIDLPAHGSETVQKLRAARADVPILVLCELNTMDQIAAALRAGADDFIMKPLNAERLHVTIRNTLRVSNLSGEVANLRRKLQSHYSFDSIVAQSPAMSHAIHLARELARQREPILLLGEPGAGKYAMARTIQKASEQAGCQFLAFSSRGPQAAALRHLLVARPDDPKSCDHALCAGNVVLFIEDIAELPFHLQNLLARRVNELRSRPLPDGDGEGEGYLWLIGATSHDVTRMTDEKSFCPDMLGLFEDRHIEIPALRERREDIAEIAAQLLREHAARTGKPISSITPEALGLLQKGEWPGNVRQLNKLISQAVENCRGSRISSSDFPSLIEDTGESHPTPPREVPAENMIRFRRNTPDVPVIDDAGNMRPLDEIEAEIIRLAISRYRGHMSEVARRLGIGRSTLYRKVRDMGLEVRASGA